MSASSADAALKAVRLSKFFNLAIEGKRAIKTSNDAKNFLEAICNEEDPPSCIERLVAAPYGLQALKMSLRSDISSAFINDSSSCFLQYIADDGVRQLCGGQLMQDILTVIIDPPTFWNEFQRCYDDRVLSPSGIHAFACLILELVSSSRFAARLNVFDVAAKALKPGGGLLDSLDRDSRSVAYKIQDALRRNAATDTTPGISKPGGRHDNDFEDFRQIAIFPTMDELTSKEQPFYLRADDVFEVEPERRLGVHLDNQFRLLREDMLSVLRDDLQTAKSSKKRKWATPPLKQLEFDHINCGDDRKLLPASIGFRCRQGLPNLSYMSEDERRKYYVDNWTILKNGCFGCLMRASEIVAFATVSRNADLLAQDPPIVLIQILGDSAWIKTLSSIKGSGTLEFISVDTPFFAYEPFLKRLQDNMSWPLSNELLGLTPDEQQEKSPFTPESIVTHIRQREGQNLRDILRLPKDVVLDHSQSEALITGLSKPLSLIQGPPGTGKSFIGAMLAKTFLESSSETILVLCFTNHALDQFLEDILDIGVPEHHVLRLGSKSSARTKSLGLYEQSANYKRPKSSWDLLNKYSADADEHSDQVHSRSTTFSNIKISKGDLLEYLQFSEDSEFFDALRTPSNDDGMVRVGKRGKQIGSSYLIDRWLQGLDAGIFQNTIGTICKKVWDMDNGSRTALHESWVRNMFQEQAVLLQDAIRDYNESQNQLNKIKGQKYAGIIREKRIIGCTTNAAARYASELSNARPGILLVEEAGEILEAHVLTALSASTKHLVLIGDHQQLRPKVNDHALTVEKGDGYDLNKSLFERLVLGGYPHQTLSKQHRMRPEISTLVRRLMYPDLQDGDKTYGRDNMRGFQSNVIFFDHTHPETDADKVVEQRYEGSKVIRQNVFEAEMVLSTVRYLAQQGYGTDKQVVLTPYLGQLRLLMDYLKEAKLDPVLNDLDSFDLVKAGLLPPASARNGKRELKISTIDNYQGEESDIVIVSLTRGNEKGDIGFLSAPQRLNVLLSRARDGLIIIGNSKTFRSSHKGRDVWVPFLDQLSESGKLYDGLPVKCERHPDKLALLKVKEDFEINCPDGGCSESCQTLLSCGKHTCPQRCHQISDHSKMKCQQIISDTCPQNHKFSWECWNPSAAICRKCEQEARKLEKKRQRDHELDQQRQVYERAYAQKLAEIDDKISLEKNLQASYADKCGREKVLQQRRKDLADAQATTKRMETNIGLPTQMLPDANAEAGSQATPESSQDSAGPADTSNSADRPAFADSSMTNVHQSRGRSKSSEAQDEWEYQKQFEGAADKSLDDLMGMIGLESVKKQVLAVKTKIDTCIRQGANMKTERFGVSLLGNPGTGKTTVARLYAKFLGSVGVIPGMDFVETTGSRLASDGVAGCKQLIENLLNAGGGAILIDEAYQLASETSPGGRQVLDFLLAEIENLTGRIVFILTGYNKPMEKFFSHNPGLPSRFPNEFQFKDYDDLELRLIFELNVQRKFEGRMKVQSGLDGLYARIFARRVGYSRGIEGFGNARAIENAFLRVLSRQATRLSRERRAGGMPDDFFLTKEDLIGPEPSLALKGNTSWEKIRFLTGLKEVKNAIEGLFGSIQSNYERELEEKPRLEFNLNRVFLGSPGTGKTTVAKLYGQVLADIGLLSNGEVVVKNPSDFIGDVVGASEKTTKGILASTVGKVLVIDEAYGLYGGGAKAHQASGDPFRTAVVDTIVAEVQSVAGDDRCVLLIGYREQMETMMHNVNPGLSRRFPLADAFEFEDFNDSELCEILEMKLKQQGYKATDQAKSAAMEVLKRSRNRPNFGNAGEVDNLLNGAKFRHQQRRSARKVKDAATLEAIDVDPDFDRGERAETNVRKLFEDTVGCEGLVARLEGYQRTVANMKARDMDPREQIPFNFLFRGPPGTGKTTTARKMGKIYYDMGFLAKAQVLEKSATDLIGEYVGQTAPKVQKLLEQALGRVLLIDEAYRLAESTFAKEAMDEVVDCLTKPAYHNKLIVILAGYDADINRLMSTNPGLTSRFPETIDFRSLEPRECLTLFTKRLQKKKHLDLKVLEEQSSTNFHQQLQCRFETLTGLKGWANARDVETLAKSIFGEVLRTADPKSSDPMPLGESVVLAAIDAMIAERGSRANYTVKMPIIGQLPIRSRDPGVQSPQKPPTLSTNTAQSSPKIEEAPPKDYPVEEQAQAPSRIESRDPGVSDEVWARLQLAKNAESEREKEYQDLLERQKILEAENIAKKKAEDEENERLLQEQEKHAEELQRRRNAADEAETKRLADEEEEAKRKREQERIKRELGRRIREDQLRRLETARKAVEEARKQEAAAQSKLRKMGLCVAGFRWIKCDGGYRCAGGSHYVSDVQLDAA